jgi:Tfp pilus assembly protein PilV
MKSHTTRQRERSRRSGTTLVETMVAIMILGGTVGGACHLTVATKCIGDQAREQYQAVTVARNHIERIRVLGYDQLPYCAESAVRVDSNGAVDNNGRFERTTTVTDVGADVKEVTVTMIVRNRISLAFDGEGESLTTLITPFRTGME